MPTVLIASSNLSVPTPSTSAVYSAVWKDIFTWDIAPRLYISVGFTSDNIWIRDVPEIIKKILDDEEIEEKMVESLKASPDYNGLIKIASEYSIYVLLL